MIRKYYLRFLKYMLDKNSAWYSEHMGKGMESPVNSQKTELTIYDVRAELDKELFKVIRQLTFSPVL